MDLKKNLNTNKENIIPMKSMKVVPTLAITIEDAKSLLEKLNQFINELMVEGLDYGRVIGFSKLFRSFLY